MLYCLSASLREVYLFVDSFWGPIMKTHGTLIKTGLQKDHKLSLLTIYHLRFPSLSIAFSTLSCVANDENLKYPSPEGPKPDPGVPTT
jgi:hypothetical protein